MELFKTATKWLFSKIEIWRKNMKSLKYGTIPTLSYHTKVVLTFRYTLSKEKLFKILSYFKWII